MYIEPTKKAIDIVGQEISLYKEYPIVNLLWTDKAIVKQEKQQIQGNNYIIKNEHMLQITSQKKADINNCILFKNKLYTVTNIDDTREGIYIILATYTNINKTYSISIPETNATIKVGDTYTINAECRENNIIISNPTITYELSDPTIASIQNNIITGLKEGSCIITCKFESAKVELSLSVQAKEEIIKKPFTVEGVGQIKVNTTQTYTIVHTDGTPTTGRKFVFEVDDPPIANIITNTDNTCVIKGILVNEFVVLTVRDSADLTQVATKNIYVVK